MVGLLLVSAAGLMTFGFLYGCERLADWIEKRAPWLAYQPLCDSREDHAPRRAWRQDALHCPHGGASHCDQQAWEFTESRNLWQSM
jgi:hypothetical protein